MHIEETQVIDAAPADVLNVFRDYRVAHPAILPKPYFGDLVIEEGGYGAGTLVRFPVRAFGVETLYHTRITEPEPGRVLVETDLNTHTETRFIVDPAPNGAARVTLSTEFMPSAGLKGLVERLLTPSFLRKLYRLELQNVADYLQRQAS
jgi:hypothetical protein